MTLYSDIGMMIIAGKRTRTTEYFTEAANEWVMLSDVPGRVEHSLWHFIVEKEFFFFFGKNLLC